MLLLVCCHRTTDPTEMLKNMTCLLKNTGAYFCLLKEVLNMYEAFVSKLHDRLRFLFK